MLLANKIFFGFIGKPIYITPLINMEKVIHTKAHVNNNNDIVIVMNFQEKSRNIYNPQTRLSILPSKPRPELESRCQIPDTPKTVGLFDINIYYLE